MSTQIPTIEIANQQQLDFDERPLLESARMILSEHGFTDGEVSIAIVDDPNMRMLNKEYLNHDYETDVLSFALDTDAEGKRLNGQLIVSADTAQSVAGEIGISLDDELLLYVVHGMLHLVGYLDKTPAEKEKMRKAEADYLSRFGVKHHWDFETDDSEAWKES